MLLFGLAQKVTNLPAGQAGKPKAVTIS